MYVTVVIIYFGFTEGITMDNNKKEYMVHMGGTFSKSNTLISAKYKSSLFDSKVMDIALANVQYDMNKNYIYARLKASDIRKLMNVERCGHFYTSLRDTAARMTGRTIGFEDPKQHVFDYIAVVTRAHYENGYFTVEFNPHLKEYLYDLKKNFSKYQLDIKMRFSNVYSYRLYEDLKSKAYYFGDQKEKVIEYRLSELKFELGIANAELDSVKKILRNSSNPDYDKALEVSDEMFKSFSHFNLKVIKGAVEEINEITDILVRYETIRVGRGGKVNGIRFFVSFKDELYTAQSDEFRYKVLGEISSILDEPLKLKDIMAIAEAAQYDVEKVKTAYDIYQGQMEHVENMVGFMISAITNAYKKSPLPDNTLKSKSRNTNKFNNFEQQTYNITEIEQLLLSDYMCEMAHQ